MTADDSSAGYQKAETALAVVTEELAKLRQNVLASLQADIQRLEVEKARLYEDIQRLKREKDNLYQERQTVQQQVWARQLAQVLANHFSEEIEHLLAQLSTQRIDNTPEAIADAENLLTTLDSSLSATFQALQQELQNHHSRLSQQLARMSSLEEQGEAILQVLVQRLQAQTQQVTGEEIELTSPPTADAPATPPLQLTNLPVLRSQISRTLSSRRLGLILVFLSALVVALYKLTVRVVFHQDSQILGLGNVQQLLPPTISNILLILFLRMVVVAILMILISHLLYPRVWTDLKILIYPAGRNRTATAETGKRILTLAVLSGVCLFFSQLLLYIAIAQIPTGVAATLFFIYPIMTILLSWLLFGQRPTMFKIGVIATICLGGVIVLAGTANSQSGNVLLGTSSAIFSGIAFAIFVILTQLCAGKLHPIPNSLIHFGTMLLLSLFGLILPLPLGYGLQTEMTHISGLLFAGFILGSLTVCGYVFNHFGVRYLGTMRSSLITATDPVLTAICAWLFISESLLGWQVLGVLVVTLGVVGLSWEKMRKVQIN